MQVQDRVVWYHCTNYYGTIVLITIVPYAWADRESLGTWVVGRVEEAVLLRKHGFFISGFD